MGNPAAAVDGYIRKNKRWSAELTALRKLVLDCGLTETVKWMVPCYTDQGRNIVLLNCFKESAGLNFVNGALLKDDAGLLRTIGQAQAGRRVPFTHVDQITAREAVLKAYVHEAVAAERAGLKVAKKTTADYAVPEELRERLDADPALAAAFAALTPGRQRGYLYYFAGAKQSKTRAQRVDKHATRILAGLGLDDN